MNWKTGDEAVVIFGTAYDGRPVYPPRNIFGIETYYEVACEYGSHEYEGIPGASQPKHVIVMGYTQDRDRYYVVSDTETWGFWVRADDLHTPTQWRMIVTHDYLINEVCTTYNAKQLIWTLEHPEMNPYLTWAIMDYIADDVFQCPEEQLGRCNSNTRAPMMNFPIGGRYGMQLTLSALRTGQRMTASAQTSRLI